MVLYQLVDVLLVKRRPGCSCGNFINRFGFEEIISRARLDAVARRNFRQFIIPGNHDFPLKYLETERYCDYCLLQGVTCTSLTVAKSSSFHLPSESRTPPPATGMS